MDENTSIEIDKENRKELSNIKYEKSFKTYNSVIKFLLDNYKKFIVKEKVNK